MSLRRNPSHRNRRKKDDPVRIVSSGRFLGLKLISELSEKVDTTEAITQNPTISITGSTAIFDYSHVRNTDDIDAINFVFRDVLTTDDTVTITKATYTNPNVGDSKEYDLAGTYTLKKYDPTTKIAILNIVSINNQSETYDRYDYRYFTNDRSLQFTTSSGITITEKRNLIINTLGINSQNSFLLTLEELHVGDIIEIEGIKETFTVSSWRIDKEDQELIEVEEDVPNNDLFGVPTLLTLSRRSTKQQPNRLFFKNSTTTKEPTTEETPVRDNTNYSTSNPNTRTPRGDMTSSRYPTTIPSAPSSDAATGRERATRRKEITLANTKAKWESSGKSTIKVKVKHGQTNYFLFYGTETDFKWSRVLTLNTGTTSKFIQKDSTNSGHPLNFSWIRDGKHASTKSEYVLDSWQLKSSKAAGNSNSWIYLTIPEETTDTIYSYCSNHVGMGSQIIIKTPTPPMMRSQEEGITFGGGIDDPAFIPTPGGPWPRINTCCTGECYECLNFCIRDVESAGDDRWAPDGCNAPNTNCVAGCTCDCGAYQIDVGCYVDDICNAQGPCKNGNRPWRGEEKCCEVCKPGFGEYLCKDCVGDFDPPGPFLNPYKLCCAEKERRSKLLIDCWRRRYTRNPCGTGIAYDPEHPENCPCACKGHVLHPDEDSGPCCDCLELAVRHNGGNCPGNCCADYKRKITRCMNAKCPALGCLDPPSIPVPGGFPDDLDNLPYLAGY